MNILIFCAHADDEVIGMGGTIRRFADAGARIRLVMFSEGAEGYADPGEKETIVATRRREAAEVARLLGIAETFNLGCLDWDLKVDNRAYRQVIGHIRDFRPDAVFTHAPLDYNDHRAVAVVTREGWLHASLACAMEGAAAWPLAPLYEFEVIQSIAAPDCVVDITDAFAAKQRAMAVYGSQTGIVGGAAQLIEGRALSRGQLVGARYGEAFTRSNYRPRPVADVAALLEH